uniref:Uncharacterized protein n=1 Tax=Romanomermis culicivorax TaxID=13658 RepID=A0A915I8G5_ROMCU
MNENIIATHGTNREKYKQPILNYAKRAQLIVSQDVRSYVVGVCGFGYNVNLMRIHFHEEFDATRR